MPRGEAVVDFGVDLGEDLVGAMEDSRKRPPSDRRL